MPVASALESELTGEPAGEPATVFYVWHLPVRVTHWVNVAAFLTLALSGYFMEVPLFAARHAPPMLQVRLVHVLAGYVLLCSVALRCYWAFYGDRGASWRAFFPYLKKDGLRKIWDELRFYLFLRRDPPPSSTVVNISHSLVFLAFGLEIVTGFALLSLSGSHRIAAPLFGWVFALAAPQNVRLIHVTAMWLLLAFTVEHIYITVMLDCKERSSLISSIVTGYMGHERHS